MKPHSPRHATDDTTRRFSRLTVLLAITAAATAWAAEVITAQSSPADSPPTRTVQEFLKLKPRWDSLVGVKFRLEGRLATGAGTTLKLAKLPVLFVADEELPDLSGSDLVVEVLAELKRGKAGVLEFRLLDVRKTESDLARLNRLRLELPRDEPGPWYELADWAMDRVSFYQSGREVDRKLREEARELYRMAIRKERTAMESPDYASLKELALKTEDYGVSSGMKLPLLYEAHLEAWAQARREGTAEALMAAALRVARELPGADKPLDIDDPDLFAGWEKSPISFYRKAPESLRPGLHRLLYQEIMLERIKTEAEPDGSNGDRIASFIEQHIPELQSLADEYRRKKQDWRISHVEELSRNELLAFREELIQAGREAAADGAVDRWLARRRIDLRKKGAEGLYDLATDYEKLFDDSETAIRLLLEADRMKPGSGYIENRLEAYGYRRVNGRWAAADEVRSISRSPIEKALSEGRVIRGMNSEQVRKARGVPDSVSRVLTSRDVIEYWSYRTSDRSRLSIRITRPLNRRSGTVRAVYHLGSDKGD